MRTAKLLQPGHADEAAGGDVVDEYETFEIFRVDCPACGQSIALFAEEEVLPQHALCPTRWNPFGLTVCAGSGSAAAEAAPTAGAEGAHEEDVAALLTLPAGLDWRRQPFSHAGGPGTRPVQRVVAASSR
ncbi:hypothetical protein N566_24955 [Streptomycetaceae bacterium MP113-05]|nr:hypothetical protein N566_24955 [Streptomycetaceae bacterium MP113-05]